MFYEEDADKILIANPRFFSRIKWQKHVVIQFDNFLKQTQKHGITICLIVCCKMYYI